MSETNPFQSRYAWGRTELVEYKSDKGERLQGVLHYPAGFEAGRKYPMVVYMYERLSDGLHSYVSPSERAPYNASVFTSRGYFFFQPDIVFRPREPGLSVVECVVPAVKQVIAKRPGRRRESRRRRAFVGRLRRQLPGDAHRRLCRRGRRRSRSRTW